MVPEKNARGPLSPFQCWDFDLSIRYIYLKNMFYGQRCLGNAMWTHLLGYSQWRSIIWSIWKCHTHVIVRVVQKNKNLTSIEWFKRNRILQMGFLNWSRLSGIGCLVWLKMLIIFINNGSTDESKWCDMAIVLCQISTLDTPNQIPLRDKFLGTHVYNPFNFFFSKLTSIMRLAVYP